MVLNLNSLDSYISKKIFTKSPKARQQAEHDKAKQTNAQIRQIQKRQAAEERRNFGISEFVEVIHRTESEIAAADRFIEEFREKINQSAEAIGERLTAVKKHQRVSVRSKLNEYQKIVDEQEKESKAIEPEIRRRREKSR